MRKLFVDPMSSNARRADMTALLLGLPVERVPIALVKGEQRRAEYMAVNPNGKVPALVDGDVVLWESLAIMIYFTDLVPGQTLYPAGAMARAQVNKWLFWAASHWGPAIGVLNFENMLKSLFGLGAPNEYTVNRFTGLFHEHARVLEATLTTHPYVAGDALTLADIAIACSLMYTGPARLPVGDYPHITTWFARIRELDAWKATEPPPFPQKS